MGDFDLMLLSSLNICKAIDYKQILAFGLVALHKVSIMSTKWVIMMFTQLDGSLNWKI